MMVVFLWSSLKFFESGGESWSFSVLWSVDRIHSVTIIAITLQLNLEVLEGRPNSDETLFGPAHRTTAYFRHIGKAVGLSLILMCGRGKFGVTELDVGCGRTNLHLQLQSCRRIKHWYVIDCLWLILFLVRFVGQLQRANRFICVVVAGADRVVHAELLVIRRHDHVLIETRRIQREFGRTWRGIQILLSNRQLITAAELYDALITRDEDGAGHVLGCLEHALVCLVVQALDGVFKARQTLSHGIYLVFAEHFR